MENLSTVGNICQELKPLGGCIRGQAGQETQRTSGFGGHGFLKYGFSTQMIMPDKDFMEWQKVESEFFRSLSNLCRLYKLPCPDVSALLYPQNIAQAFRETKERLRQLNPGVAPLIINDGQHRATVATAKMLPTGYDLYYVPVGMVYEWWKLTRKRTTVQLIFSVFAYLYTVLEVPYYAEESSYLYDDYESLMNWLEDTEHEWIDKKAYKALMEEFDFMKMAGRELLDEMKRPVHLAQFETRVNQYKARTGQEENLLAVCRDALALYSDYPTRSLLKSIPALFEPENSDGDVNRLSGHMYISFFWGNESEYIEENLMEQLNTNFYECDIVDEPTVIQFFDRVQRKESLDMDFQQRAMKLLVSLAAALYH